MSDAQPQMGDYYEGLAEGIRIGRLQALEQAAIEATRPAGGVLIDFSERQTIIVNRIKRLALREPSNRHTIQQNSIQEES